MTNFRIPLILAVAFLLSAQTADERLDLERDYGKMALIISADEGGCYLFDVYVATTRAQQMQGLMWVREMPATQGMIFIYRRAGLRSMWMKNTYIPLDILFIRADGSVSSIAKNTEPHSLKSVSAVENVNFVLELNAGITDRLNIGTESRVFFSDPE